MTISSAGPKIKRYLEELEDELYAASLAAGRKALVDRLERLDDELAVRRERKEYRDKHTPAHHSNASDVLVRHLDTKRSVKRN